MNNTMENWLEFQKETMSKVFEMTTGVDGFKSMNPIDVINQFKDFNGGSENTKKITENNLKYHKAFIAYHQALYDMMEAINDNTTLMTSK